MDRLYPALSRHEIATAQGEAIQLRWENEMKQAADELQAILNARSDDDGECVADLESPLSTVFLTRGVRRKPTAKAERHRCA